MFRRRHRIGLRLNVHSDEGENRKLALIVKYSNSSNSFESGGDQTWLQHNVCIFLGQAKATEAAGSAAKEG